MIDDQLRETGRKKSVDRITAVTHDVHMFVRNMSELFDLGPWHIYKKCRCDLPSLNCGGREDFCYYEAILPLERGLELQAVEPVFGDTVYGRFFDRFGDGIMGLRERIAQNEWQNAVERMKNSGFDIIQSLGDEQLWFDCMDTFGGVITYIRDDSSEKAAAGGTSNICQICLVTDDVERSARQISKYLSVGPWEIGKADLNTVPDMACSGYAAGKMPKSFFKIGIAEYGNLQFELIQPVEGPVPYFRFLNRRGTGFHHIKQMLKKEDWSAVVGRCFEAGLDVALSGHIGPCGWCNWDTEDVLGFVYEMNDDTPMTALPDGYDAYFIK